MQLLRYNKRDGVVVLVVLAFAASFAWLAMTFSAWSWSGLFALMILLAFVRTTVVANAFHYHAHTPFFVSKILNRSFSALGSALLGETQVIYRHGHFWHHQYTISYSPYGLAEFVGFLPVGRFVKTWLLYPLSIFGLRSMGYCLIAHQDRARDISRPTSLPSEFATADDYLAAAIPFIRYKARRLGAPFRRELYLETAALFFLRLALLIINWKFFVFVFLPFSLFFHFSHRYGEYCDHFGSPATVEHNTSASSYGTVFNLLTLNAGYHQEHHLHGAIHWHEIPRVRQEISPDVQRRIVPRALLFNALFARS